MKKAIWITATLCAFVALTLTVAAPLNGGDPNCDDVNNVSDATYLVDFLWRGGPEPCEIPAQNSWEPIAWGIIDSDGVIRKGSTNFTCTWTGLSYEITITGESYYFLDWVTLVTPVSGDPALPRTTSGMSKLYVTFHNLAGETTQRYFSFVTYKP